VAAAREREALVARRRQLVDLRTAESNRLLTASPAVRDDIARHLDWLAGEIAALDERIARATEADAARAARAALLRSAKGVGPVLAATLTALLPELGTLDRKLIAALVGLAPFNRDSGTRRGTRSVWGGRAPVRAALSMPTIAAMRCNPAIRAVRDRLAAAGKPPKVVIVACMRKLLKVLNAMVRDGVPWTPRAAQPRSAAAAGRRTRPAASPADLLDTATQLLAPQRGREVKARLPRGPRRPPPGCDAQRPTEMGQHPQEDRTNGEHQTQAPRIRVVTRVDLDDVESVSVQQVRQVLGIEAHDMLGALVEPSEQVPQERAESERVRRRYDQAGLVVAELPHTIKHRARIREVLDDVACHDHAEVVGPQVQRREPFDIADHDVVEHSDPHQLFDHVRAEVDSSDVADLGELPVQALTRGAYPGLGRQVGLSDAAQVKNPPPSRERQDGALLVPEPQGDSLLAAPVASQRSC
jgi:hypothetical protein